MKPASTTHDTQAAAAQPVAIRVELVREYVHGRVLHPIVFPLAISFLQIDHLVYELADTLRESSQDANCRSLWNVPPGKDYTDDLEFSYHRHWGKNELYEKNEAYLAVCVGAEPGSANHPSGFKDLRFKFKNAKPLNAAFKYPIPCNADLQRAVLLSIEETVKATIAYQRIETFLNGMGLSCTLSLPSVDEFSAGPPAVRADEVRVSGQCVVAHSRATLMGARPSVAEKRPRETKMLMPVTDPECTSVIAIKICKLNYEQAYALAMEIIQQGFILKGFAHQDWMNDQRPGEQRADGYDIVIARVDDDISTNPRMLVVTPDTSSVFCGDRVYQFCYRYFGLFGIELKVLNGHEEEEQCYASSP